jgi:hypothetical protein
MENSNIFLKEERTTVAEYALKVALHVATVTHQNDNKKVEDLSRILWQRVEEYKASAN